MKTSEIIAANPQLINEEVLNNLSELLKRGEFGVAASLLRIPNSERTSRKQLLYCLERCRSAIERFLIIQEKGIKPGLEVRVSSSKISIVHKITVDGYVIVKGENGTFHPWSVSCK